MPVAQGSNAKLRMYPETTFGTFPTSVNFHQAPFFSYNVSPVQSLDQDAILSSVANRDSGDPYFGLIQLQGDVSVPVDTVHFGRWLRLLFGAPSTSGTTNYTHVYSSGSAAIPSNGIEIAHADLTTALYLKQAGIMANTLRVGIDPQGAATATIGLMGLTETKATSTGAGTPVVTAYTRYFNVQGSVSRGGSALTGVTAFDFTFSNDMEMIAAIRSDYRMDDVDLGLAQAAGNITMRFKDATEYDAAVATQTAAAITCGYTIGSNTSVIWNFGRCFIAPAGRPITGPRGISQQFRFVAGPHASTGVVQCTYKNQTASYATV